MKTEFKKGDNVTIVPNDSHEAHVKKSYGKTLKIERVVNTETDTLYKVKGIADYALESDLRLIQQESE